MPNACDYGPGDTLADVISLAAVKNGEFTRNPQRSNSLALTLLQRRHWFHLLAIHEESRHVATPTRRSHSIGSPAVGDEVKRDAEILSTPRSRKRHGSLPSTTYDSDSDSDSSESEGGCQKNLLLILRTKSCRDKLVITSKKRRCEVDDSRH